MDKGRTNNILLIRHKHFAAMLTINIEQIDHSYSNQNSNKCARIRAFDLWALSLIFAYL